MKRLLLFAITTLTVLPLFADLVGDGYYHVQSAKTKRYAYLLDNKGSYNASTTSADVGALALYTGRDQVLSDPAAVFYLKSAPQGNYYYDVCGQGTSVHSFIDLYLRIHQDRTQYDGATTYTMYASASGVVKYLGDVWDDFYDPEGMASADAKGDSRRWYLHPIDASSDEYFGVSPSVTAKGKYYAPFFAAFPFSAKSSGIKFYVISEIDSRGAAIIKEVDGAVPASTPVIIECSSELPAENRLDLGTAAAPVTDNKLKGIYFDSTIPGHFNRTPFNKQTMRVLGVGKDGRPAFVQGNYDYIPRNQAYLQLTDPKQYNVKEFILMTSEQRDIELVAVEEISVDALVDVYSIDGHLIRSSIRKADVHDLGKGLYILRCGEAMEKMMVH